ncbi:hypothetical protein CNMCM5623_009047 [Aspergillus felis]|uniref:Xylanolytic transcriptional activator regulatory domain-containing protein n=1 Tax=Aspergillus felis TaxID=1287682 RepID=A0A8H6USU2_9EURO|nr:hypothetical protein CNMCM5623_009047 [Aspergillus felis]
MPFTHAPTFKLDECSPELCLAIFAVGAAARYEFKTSAALRKLTTSETDATPVSRIDTDEVSCLLCPGWLATWQTDLGLQEDSMILRGLLAQTLRLTGLREARRSSDIAWEAWAKQESERRTKLFAFCFLNTQSIVHNLPPIICSYEIDLKLPCSCPEWTAPDSVTWRLLHQDNRNGQPTFHDALKALLITGQDTMRKCVPTPAANYVLLHGLIQDIIWTPTPLGNLNVRRSSDQQELFQTALRTWTTAWQKTPESNLEPFDPNGPLPFTSGAMLSFAYIRNCFWGGDERSRGSHSWDPVSVADGLRARPAGKREWSQHLAAQHAVHTLGILVKLGIEYVKRNQGLILHVEAALCGLECAVFLDKWLREPKGTVNNVPLTESELHLVNWIKDVVKEGFASTPCTNVQANMSDLDSLADCVLEIWSYIMQGNFPWAFVNMVGDVIIAYRSNGR